MRAPNHTAGIAVASTLGEPADRSEPAGPREEHRVLAQPAQDLTRLLSDQPDLAPRITRWRGEAKPHRRLWPVTLDRGKGQQARIDQVITHCQVLLNWGFLPARCSRERRRACRRSAYGPHRGRWDIRAARLDSLPTEVKTQASMLREVECQSRHPAKVSRLPPGQCDPGTSLTDAARQIHTEPDMRRPLSTRP
jgi:hypothetical protein